MRTFSLFLSYIIFTLITSSPVYAAVKIVNQRYAFSKSSDKTYYLPYKSNYAIDMKNSDIKHVIIPIHSAEYNVEKLFNDYKKLISKYDHAKFSTLIFTPQFNREIHVKNVKEDKLLLWKASPFWGSQLSRVITSEEYLKISAYMVLEDIISSLCNKDLFPNLERITIAGHSNGGEFVQRFAAGNTVGESVAAEAGVKVRYVAMSISTYMYLSEKRRVGESRREFAVPGAEQIKAMPAYNRYGYGLIKPYEFFRNKDLDDKKIRAIYPERNIIYIAGQGTEKPGRYFNKAPEAMLQGDNRYERAKIFFGHLVDEFGPKIMKTQKLIMISGIENSFDEVVFSAKSAKFILGR